MSVTVRSIEARDEDEWRRLWAGYLDFYQAYLTDEATATLFANLVKGAPHFAFVAECGGKLVGFVHGLPHASTWAPQGYCYLEDLYVDPDTRRTGAGRALIEAVYAEADKRGLARVYWHTDDGNKTARSLYDKLAQLSDFVQYRRTG